MSNVYNSTFAYKVIYVFRINDKQHAGLVKIGDATLHSNKNPGELLNNSTDLNQAAKARINSYTVTAGIQYDLLHTELACYYKEEKGRNVLKFFRDHKVHEVLLRSNVKRKELSSGREWFECDLETAKNAIEAVKNGWLSLDPNNVSFDNNPIIFRPEQKEAIEKTLKVFKTSGRMLWNAKMRFGKTLSALEVARIAEYKKVLIFTHRPVVDDGWYDDFGKIFYGTNYKYGSKNKGESINNLINGTNPFVYFASIQDLRGSSVVGGKFDKNEEIFKCDWDLLIVDEAHEGTQTTLGQKVLSTILENNPDKKPKLLELSGTPFNLLANFKESEIYTWDYIMEQRAKLEWDLKHFGDTNPYEELPKLEIFTFDINNVFAKYIDIEDSAFNFREFFRVWTGDINRDFKVIPSGAQIGDFVHKEDVLSFLDLITRKDDETNYPFATEEYRSYYHHTLWMVPGVKEAKALSALMKEHPIFSQFNIVNVAGEGDEDSFDEKRYKDALAEVRGAIGEHPLDSYSITISCGRLTTGVTVPEWTGVFMLAGSFSTAASNYLQTIFRVQSPANIEGRMKTHCSVFDFAPDRTLKMVAEASKLSTNAGNAGDRKKVGEFLNYCPVIAILGTTMQHYDVDKLLQQLKKAYTDRVVKNGFDDRYIYNDNLLKLDDIELQDFESLKGIIGVTKQTEKVNQIDINNQGFTDEEYQEVENLKKKPKKELTPEEKAKLEELKKKRENASKAMSILRGISIRIPLLIYGADVPLDKDITVDNFVDLVDDESWKEFMPNGVTKEVYKKFAKYYEQDIFVSAGRQIRQMAASADKLAPTERVIKLAEIFRMFKNPDKETVLTPWRVVNMHMSETLGGYCFYDETFDEGKALDEPRLVIHENVTDETLFKDDAHILEINSKTGLYPLYVTYSIFRHKIDKIPNEQLTDDTVWNVWKEVVENNIYVICKTKMAKYITKRTLLGYKNGKINAHAFDDLVTQIKDKQQQFIDKVTRGNFWNKGGVKMKFDAVVGNPPYQLNIENRSEQPPIYHVFYDVSFNLSDRVTLISPGRFLFDVGKTPSEWNKKMLNDSHVKVIKYFPNSKEVFDSVDIKGGVTIIYRDNTLCFEPIKIFTLNNVIKDIVSKVKTVSVQSLSDIIFSNTSYKYSSLFFLEHPELRNRVSGGSVRYLSSSVFDNLNEVFYEKKMDDNYVKILGLKNKIRKYMWFDGRFLNPPLNFNKYKVFVPSSNGSGALGEVLSTPVIGHPVIGHTETFISIGCFETEKEAENLLNYLKTKFARMMLGTKKVTQGNKTPKTWENVPMQNFSNNGDIDWDRSISEIDKQLYLKYKLNENEISFIESKIQPME